MTLVDELSYGQYRDLLILIIESEKEARGRLKTATAIQLQRYLDVLLGASTFAELDVDLTFFTREQLLNELKLPAVYANCYLRMVRELTFMRDARAD